MWKKTILPILSVPLVGLLLLFLLFVFLEWSETIERHFHDYQQLELAKAASPGLGTWFPAFLPESAKDIRIKYNLDTNQAVLAFRFDSRSDLNLTDHCSKASVNDIEYARGTARWWPTTMLKESPSSKELAPYQIYRCGQNAFMVVETTSEAVQAYFWRN